LSRFEHDVAIVMAAWIVGEKLTIVAYQKGYAERVFDEARRRVESALASQAASTLGRMSDTYDPENDDEETEGTEEDSGLPSGENFPDPDQTVSLGPDAEPEGAQERARRIAAGEDPDEIDGGSMEGGEGSGQFDHTYRGNVREVDEEG
jgi:hypothetical protein